MTWPLLSNGLSEVGILSTVSFRGSTRFTKPTMICARLLSHARDPSMSARVILSPTIRSFRLADRASRVREAEKRPQDFVNSPPWHRIPCPLLIF